MKKTVIFENKIMKNEANLNSPKFTASSCSRGTYNVFYPKTQNGTKPNEANFRNGKSPIFQKNKKMENEPNFNESKVPQVTALKRFTTLFSKRKRTQTNPIKANQSQFPGENIIKRFGATEKYQLDITCLLWSHVGGILSPNSDFNAFFRA